MPMVKKIGPMSLARYLEVAMSCPFAGMTRIRFKGFFSAQHRAPLGVPSNLGA
jgi:hypothetical protein